MKRQQRSSQSKPSNRNMRGCLRRQSVSRPMVFHPLEPRKLLSALLTDGVLAITGTEGRDQIRVLAGDVAGQVFLRGVDGVEDGAVFDGVDAIQITSLSGNDQIIIESQLRDTSDNLIGVTIDAGQGNNRIETGDGDDIITAGDGRNKVESGDGNDTITLGNGRNKVESGAGDDTITTGSGADKIEAGDGNDTINAGDGNNRVKGDDGDDLITTGLGNDKIEGGDGDDTIDAGDGNNKVKGDKGNDTITAGIGHDKIEGGDGDDTIDAGDGNNKVKGGKGNDTITAGSGHDKIEGGDGDDVIDGGDGDNRVKGNAGDDRITTGSGSDRIDGGDGIDIVDSGAGDDHEKNEEDDVESHGFWHGKKGQKLLKSLNEGPDSTALGDWLASTFPNMYGPDAGDNSMLGATNTEVAAFVNRLQKRSGKERDALGLSASPKMDVKILAVALSVYVTTESLAGDIALDFGFIVTEAGLGAEVVSVGSHGAAVGLADNTQVTVMEILARINDRALDGILYDMDGDGDANDDLEDDLRHDANSMISDLLDVEDDEDEDEVEDDPDDNIDG